MSNDREKLKKYQTLLENGVIDQAEFDKLTADLSLSVDGERNVTAASGSAAVGGAVGRDLITGQGHSITTIINNFAGDSPRPVDEKTLRRQIADYLQWVVDHHSRIELRGIKRKGEQVVQLDLETVYVPLRASDAHRRGEISLDAVLQQGRHIVITGGPGSGKTTVLLHMAYTLAIAAGADQPRLAAEKLGLAEPLPLPILVPLSHFALYRRHLPPGTPGEQRTLAAFITDFLQGKQASFSLPPEFFKTLLQRGQNVLLLLDGLDEVPDEKERAEVREAIEELLDGRSEQLRVVVTCRTAAYKGRTAIGRGFREVEALPLDEAHIRALISQAYTCIIKKDEVERTARIDDLVASIKQLEADRRARYGEQTERLVTSPLLVRMLLIVHYSNDKLPEQRAALYQKATDAMLRPDYNLDTAVANRIGGLVGESENVHREMAQHLAYRMHQRGQKQGREVDEETLQTILEDHPIYDLHTADFIELTRQRGTLLEERLRHYRFLHLAFQEYMTARYLVEVVRSVDEIAGLLEAGPLLDSWWREVIILITGYLSIDNPTAAGKFVRRLAGLERQPADLPHETRLAGAELAGSSVLDWPTAPAALRADVTGHLTRFFNDETWQAGTGPKLRALAGDTLNRLGDERPGVGVVQLPGQPVLPQLQFCYIPPGRFWLGDDAGESREKPCHRVELPDGYWLARYPVTVAQWQAFVQSGHQPKNAASLRDPLNRPVRYVTWNEAVAYCRWLTGAWQAVGLLPVDWVVRLPSEAAWEKAARGGERIPSDFQIITVPGDGILAMVELPQKRNQAEKRRYPWGDEAEANRLNYRETGIGTTSAVGCFPGGVSPYGCEEMSGNVWEWCSTVWDEKAYLLKGIRDEWSDEYLKRPDRRVLRGGAFDLSEVRCRCAYRLLIYPYDGFNDGGFRVMLSPL